MWTILGSVFTSILSGGMTGIFGVAVQRIADYKNKQLDIELATQKMAHELELRKADAEIMREEWAARTKVAIVEERGKESVADAGAFAASFQMEPVRYSDASKASNAQGWLFVILDFIRGLVRPCLTVYLCILTTLVYFQARKLIEGEILSAEQALELVKLTVSTVLYLTTTCTLWWFGTRNKQKPPQVKKAS